MLAAFPTIKFTDQKIVVRINNIYARLFLFDTCLALSIFFHRNISQQ